MKNKIKTREVKEKPKIKIEYYIDCPKCPKEIKGTSKSQVEYNFKLHMEKHKKEDKK